MGQVDGTHVRESVAGVVTVQRWVQLPGVES